jgi:hypothetical protein
MKKTYILPKIEIVKLKSHYQLLAGSSQDVYNETPSEYGARGSFDFDDCED